MPFQDWKLRMMEFTIGTAMNTSRTMAAGDRKAMIGQFRRKASRRSDGRRECVCVMGVAPYAPTAGSSALDDASAEDLARQALLGTWPVSPSTSDWIRLAPAAGSIEPSRMPWQTFDSRVPASGTEQDVVGAVRIHPGAPFPGPSDS